MKPKFETTKVQANLGDIVGSIPDHCSKVRIAIKRVFVFFLVVEDLAFSLCKKQ